MGVWEWEIVILGYGCMGMGDCDLEYGSMRMGGMGDCDLGYGVWELEIVTWGVDGRL